MSSLKIPYEKIVEGIGKILNNTSRYIKDSKVLLKDGSLEHAVVCAVFAAEELAKAGMLSKQFEEHEGEPFIEMPTCDHRRSRFYCHECKLQEAKKLLGDTLIIESSRLGIARLPFRLGVDDKEVTHPIRLLCAFVDFEDGEWKFGTPYNPSMLKLDLLKGIEEKLNEIATKHGLGEGV